MGNSLVKRSSDRGTAIKLSTDVLLRAVGLAPSTGEVGHLYAPPTAEKRGAYCLESGKPGQAVGGLGRGDPSVLDDLQGNCAELYAGPDTSFLTQVLTGARYKAAEHVPSFAAFELPNGFLLEPHRPKSFVKQALMPVPQQPLAQPNLQQAQQAMGQFMPQASAAPPLNPQAPPIAQGAAGMPAAAPGHQTLTGVAQRPIGLDQPCDTRATAMPGTPGHAATNVIDQRGGLDPRGMTVDGNNAAGIKKLGSSAMPEIGPDGSVWVNGKQYTSKMPKLSFSAGEMDAAYERIMAGPKANWFTAALYNPHTVVGQLNLMAKMSKTAGSHRTNYIDQSTDQAVDQSTRPSVDQSTQNDLQPGFKVAVWFDQQNAKRKKKPMGSAPWLGMGLGLGAAGAYGAAKGLASDDQIANVRKSVLNYRPEAFTEGKLPPNQTGLTYYQNILSPAAQLRPFGQPIGNALVGLRSDPDLMKAMGTEAYALKTPAEQAGVNGMAHYTAFGNGPMQAYMHQIDAKFPKTPVPAELGVPAGTSYADWMGRKLKDFVGARTGGNNPAEVTTGFMPHEQQVKMMEDFHASLPPAEQAHRLKTEDPGPGYANQVNNYLPKAKGYADFRDNLQNAGIAGGGAAAGALGGHLLYNGLTDDENETTTGRTLSSLAGAGLGGGAAYLAGTEHGRGLVGSGLQGIKNMLLGTKRASADQDALIAKGHGSWKCKCGASGSCRCSASHDLPERTREICPECETKWDTNKLVPRIQDTTTKQASQHVSTGRYITYDELMAINNSMTPEERQATLDRVRMPSQRDCDWFHRELKRQLGQEKAAHVEPLTRWVSPPSEPLDPEFMKSEGVQALLRALHCEATPDGQIKALTIHKPSSGLSS